MNVLHFAPADDLRLFEYDKCMYYQNPYGEVVVQLDGIFYVVNRKRELLPANSLEEMEDILDKLRK